ncbi:hypothetical protein CDA63_07625 [Hymenobacter amundsenii]|uniref:Carboxypeptidase regulatory-like domain-containing protein n=1 Tax=Hymenobacter amundsenii TaxID=2006685 RepID=A0A246FLQ8_9BACT|nr:hypothetical protein [Hymenobacter amundsenii]OWP63653.1 hypothetical protein CDA63_07625 [Hymenobacter amundsenii]
MRHFILISISAALLLSGCTKQGPTLVSGLVVDKDTDQPVPNAEVQVHAFSGGGSSGGGGYGPALGGPYRADADGKFAFTFEADRGKTYRLDAYGPLGHFSVDQGVEVANGRTNRNLRIPVQAPGWVRVRIIDEPPTISEGVLIIGGIGPKGYTFRLPLQQVETFVIATGANIPSRLSWTVTLYEEKTTTDYHQNITIPSLDTVTVTIRF